MGGAGADPHTSKKWVFFSCPWLCHECANFQQKYNLVFKRYRMSQTLARVFYEGKWKIGGSEVWDIPQLVSDDILS